MSLTDAKQDIERIRRVREKPVEPSEESEVEVFTCPIEGCNRTVIGSPGHLRNHVSQSSDIRHRFRTLNGELEIEFDEEAYHAEWGPGLSEDDDEERESIYEPGDPWGPGIPA